MSTDHTSRNAARAIEDYAAALGAGRDATAWALHQARQGLRRGVDAAEVICSAQREIRLWIKHQHRISRRVAECICKAAEV